MIYADTLELLQGDPNFWVCFTQSQVFLKYERVYDTAVGIYHWEADIHVFTLQTYGNVLVVCGGPLHDAEWNFYSIDPVIEDAFVVAKKICRDALRSIQKMDA